MTTYKLFALIEIEAIINVWIAKTLTAAPFGLSGDKEKVVSRKHVGDYESLNDAEEEIYKCDLNPKHGFEIVKSYKKYLKKWEQ